MLQSIPGNTNFIQILDQHNFFFRDQNKVSILANSSLLHSNPRPTQILFCDQKNVSILANSKAANLQNK